MPRRHQYEELRRARLLHDHVGMPPFVNLGPTRVVDEYGVESVRNLMVRYPMLQFTVKLTEAPDGSK